MMLGIHFYTPENSKENNKYYLNHDNIMSKSKGKGRSKSKGKKLSFRQALTADQARKDIGGKAVRFKGKTLITARKGQSSAGSVFTIKELITAKKRGFKLATGKSLKNL